MHNISLRNSLIGCLVFFAPVTMAQGLSEQCIEAPKRVYACDNLIYTSIKRADVKEVVCVCRPDKDAILSFLEKDSIATQRIMIRKLLAKHQMTKIELIEVLSQIN